MTIRPEDLQEYCGPPTKFGMPMYDLGKLPVGVVAGVAYVPAASSGSVLYVHQTDFPPNHLLSSFSPCTTE